MKHICVSKLTIIGSNNGLAPGRRQAIIWTNVGILLIWTLETNFSEIFIDIHTFSFCLGHHVLKSHYSMAVSITVWHTVIQSNVKHSSTMLQCIVWGIPFFANKRSTLPWRHFESVFELGVLVYIHGPVWRHHTCMATYWLTTSIWNWLHRLMWKTILLQRRS